MHMKATDTQNTWGRWETVLIEEERHSGFPGGKGRQQEGRDCASAQSLTCGFHLHTCLNMWMVFQPNT